VEPAATGQPSYHPSVLLKLYIHGYLNLVQSSRRLEREAGRNVEVMWLLGRLAPDHKTIADFRKDNGLALRNTSICSRLCNSGLTQTHKPCASVARRSSISCQIQKMTALPHLPDAERLYASNTAFSHDLDP
jgi:hypothetical protein